MCYRMNQKHYSLLLLFFLFFSFSNIHSQKLLSGKVIDSKTQEALVGTIVKLVKANSIVVTDIEGNFTIQSTMDSDEILFSYTGYETIQMPIGGQNYFSINLVPGKLLDEVILIGYGSQKKSDKTGAVMSVNSNELNIGGLSDPIQGLQGKVAGVTISKQGGDPNAGFTVNIRGAAGLTSGTGPLYVIDGVPGVDPTTVANNDIESYNVLKDASSTAIYGSRGSNGVIIIKTKNSGLSKSDEKVHKVEYSGQYGFDQVSKKLNFLNSSQMRDFANKTGRTYIDNGANIDWQDAIFRSGFTQDHTLAFSGTDNHSSYRASLSQLNIKGVLEGSGKQRSIGRLQFTQSGLKDRLTVYTAIGGTIEHNDYVNYGGGISPTNILYQAFRRSPTDPIYNADGTYFETDRSFQYFNPVAIIKETQNERDAKRFFGNVDVRLKLFSHLVLGVNGAYTRNDDESFYFEPSYAASNTTKGFAKRTYNNGSSQLIETTLNYDLNYRSKHSFNILGGHSYQKDSYDGFFAQGKEALSDYLKSYNLGALINLEPGSIGSYKNEFLQASFFGRLVYDFNKKYYLTATMRRDGSSKFGKNNEWGWFPSASVAWNIMGESFMNSVHFFDDLKLRLGYGITGNQNIPTNVDAIFFIPAGTAIDPESGNKVISFQNNGGVNANPDLKWEENAEFNIGLDFGILKNRLSGSLEYYRKTTSDLIYNYELPVPPNKNRFIYANAGQITNNGVEVSLFGIVIDRKKLDWKTTFTFSKNNQKTKKLANDKYDLDEIKTLYVSGRGLVGGENYSQVIRPGFEIGTFFLPEYAGLSDDGKFLFYTKAGGVTRDVSKAERREVGHAQPDFSLGWSNYLKFGAHLDASIAMRAVVGFDVLNVTRLVFSNPSDLPTLNVLEEALDEYDRGLTSSPILSDYYLEDGTFLKIDNVTVGYNFGLNKSKYLKGFRIYVAGSNLLTLTRYKGLDPELSYGGVEFGRDQYDVYPKTRSITLGLNATF